ncbi:MAG: CPBP family intramembrane metalloprotease [Acidobacteria bacterium]|nr:MAG: CPBP family intramembrane metalloprotease [Acidobacteriota bacterium]REK02293.1 MAG: CPBP family intramembrane metalloprotease [Acidobacteriota bacterium]REK13904.1 MAG: CPBP family intramembrane metalloprotease [Acidobacteriota bacterium]REK41898.1 MAG: CPBP family intramembrane metalloprotease [Acidobacteriota bacterium]
MNSVLFDSQGRLRSGWRFAIFAAVFIVVVTLAVSFAQGIFLALRFEPRENILVLTTVTTSVSLAVALVLGWGAGKILEDLPFKALGASFTKGWAWDLFWGLVLGAAAVSVAAGFAALFGNLGFTFNAEASLALIFQSAAISFVVFFFGAAFEEALVRGYIFQTFVRSKLAWLAILLTSLIFASGHLDNPSSGTFSFVNTFLAGIWLGFAYLKTRTLWLAFGLHLAWNFVLGSFYGIEVSGLTQLAQHPFLQEIDGGPEWITGGAYGLEGGFACTFALVVATLGVWFAPFLKADEEMVALTSPPEESPDEHDQNPERQRRA